MDQLLQTVLRRPSSCFPSPHLSHLVSAADCSHLPSDLSSHGTPTLGDLLPGQQVPTSLALGVVGRWHVIH